MALSKEDHKDVKHAMGKALANKVAKVTRDGDTVPKMPKTVGFTKGGAPYTQEHEDALASTSLKRYKEKSRGARMTKRFLD